MLASIFEDFHSGSIEYAVLRNHERIEVDDDIDLVTQRRDGIHEIMLKYGFRKRADYGYYLSYKGAQYKFDFKIGCLPYQGFYYKSANELMAKRQWYDCFYILGDEDELCHLVLHSVIDKGYFKVDYIETIQRLKGSVELSIELYARFGDVGQEVASLVENGDYDKAVLLRRQLMLKLCHAYGLWNLGMIKCVRLAGRFRG